MDWLAYGAAIVLFTALTVYALSGGADFGGGVWDLLAQGSRAAAQRQTIAHAIGPIWETNHVWMILAVVVMFTGFPRVFEAVSVTLHIPITLALIGIVLRGSAFAFRSFDAPGGVYRRRWSYTFAAASVVTPLLLGMVVGAVASGQIRLDPATGRVAPEFFRSWLAPFPIAVGVFAVALFAFLAAVYLTLETDDRALQEDFRIRALGAAVVVGILALACLLLSRQGAPLIRAGLASQPWSLPFHALTGIAAVSAMVALWQRRYRWARRFAMAQVVLILWGWALAQAPYLVVPDYTIINAAAAPKVLATLLIVLGCGAVLLVPALWYLFTLFKRPSTNA
ncbi:MAG TPA: cytochrome d ubiquinol oxidase subunit II [bacterium]